MVILRFLFFGFIFFSLFTNAKPINFSLYKLDSNNQSNKPALLIISGIQGDEPGGFNATSILIKHYKILDGNIWIVPNLNQHSILRNNRGIYGDMNRKFANLSKNDPEYQIIQNIKKIILDENVARILHLHDGSGFYRETYINNLLNQNRWGNCSVIDQKTLFEINDLNNNITQVVDYINTNLLDELHRYRVRNTNTSNGDTEQDKSLTYFATINKKMAFANEASKSLPLNQRVYYHLLAIEGMMKSMDIKFDRDFNLDIKSIDKLINHENTNIVINDIIEIPLHDIKPIINYFPAQKGDMNFYSNTPIVWLFKDGKNYRIKHGNKNITQLKPFYIEFDYSLKSINIIIDGNEVEAPIGTIVSLKDSFIIPQLDYRVNVIGYYKENIDSEVGIEIKKDDLMDKFSIDKDGKKYRIEFYKQTNGEEDKFAGMIILDFKN